MKKVFFILYALTTAASLLGCSDSSVATLNTSAASEVSGKYVDEKNKSKYIELKSDGTFTTRKSSGTYRINGDKIMLTITSTQGPSTKGVDSTTKEVVAALANGVLILNQDSDSPDRYIKQSSTESVASGTQQASSPPVQQPAQASDVPSDSKLIELSIPGIYGNVSPGMSPNKLTEGRVTNKQIDGNTATVKFRSTFRSRGCGYCMPHGIFPDGSYGSNEVFDIEYTLRYRRIGSDWAFDAIVDSSGRYRQN